jgi:thiol-disulfide isomerase/thioredoxin
MPSALLLPLLTCSAVLVVSGVAKLRDPSSVDVAFSSLRVPGPVDGPWVRRLLPWLEIALGLWLLVATGAALVLVAFLVLALFAAYLVLVARALRGPEPADCGCFGALGDSRVTRATVWRNALLVVAALLTLVAGFKDAAVLLNVGEGSLWAWVLAAALTAAIAVLVTWRDPSSPGAEAAVALGAVDDDGEYVRAAIPDVQVQTEDGRMVLLDREVLQGALLLVFLSPGCGPCGRIGPLLAGWGEDLAPVRVRAVAIDHPGIAEAFPFFAGVSYYDPYGFARRAFDVGTPAAVLLGTDGYLAGGPVQGEEAIHDFVAEVTEHLREAGVPVDAEESPASHVAPGTVVEPSGPGAERLEPVSDDR